MDVGACKKLLNGSQIVSKYKNEAERSFYVEKEDGTYEPLCDANCFSTIIAESEMYYKDERNRIWYVDFAAGQSELFYENPSRELYEIELVNYDAAYVYATQERNIGYMADGYGVTETYLIRIPRAGGDTQKVYRFEYSGISGRGCIVTVPCTMAGCIWNSRKALSLTLIQTACSGLTAMNPVKMPSRCKGQPKPLRRRILKMMRQCSDRF